MDHKGWRKHDDMEELKMCWVCSSDFNERCVLERIEVCIVKSGS